MSSIFFRKIRESFIIWEIVELKFFKNFLKLVDLKLAAHRWQIFIFFILDHLWAAGCLFIVDESLSLSLTDQGYPLAFDQAVLSEADHAFGKEANPIFGFCVEGQFGFGLW